MRFLEYAQKFVMKQKMSIHLNFCETLTISMSNDLSEKSSPNDNDAFRGMTSNHLSQKMHIRFSLNDFGARGFLIEMSKNF